MYIHDPHSAQVRNSRHVHMQIRMQDLEALKLMAAVAKHCFKSRKSTAERKEPLKAEYIAQSLNHLTGSLGGCSNGLTSGKNFTALVKNWK